MRIRIGANPIGWSNDDMPEIGGDISLEQCLSEARKAGFQGMELGNKFPREPRALAAALEPYGLRLVSGWYSSELLLRSARDEMKALRPHLDLLKAMGCKVLVFCETSNAVHGKKTVPLSRRPILPATDWPEFGRRVSEVAERIFDEGLRLVYHHHMGTIVQSREDIDALMSATGDAVHLLLDTGHATWGGADPALLAKHYHTRIGHFHAKDVRADIRQKADREDWSFLDSVLAGVYTVPGDGMVDFYKVLKALAPYSGWMVVEAEQDPKKAHPLTYARKGYAHLRSAAESVGFQIET